MIARLLVSVRSASEARDALVGGADLIDIKEPAHGSLGRAEGSTIAATIKAVAGQAPVSAALGEWTERITHELPAGLTWAKWGLSGVRTPGTVAEVRQSLTNVQPVLVAYADAERAASFTPSEMVHWAITYSFPVLLIDTFVKDGSTLLDWLDVTAFAPFAAQLRQAHVQLALAGSLRLPHIEQLKALQPTWYAIRGAACQAGQREGPICPDRVRQWKTHLAARGESA